MKVKDLIAELQKMPQEADVYALYDGHCRSGSDLVWESNDASVLICGYGEYIANDCDRPSWAEPKSEIDLWYTQEDPNRSDGD